jgi:hypothetical protein
LIAPFDIFCQEEVNWIYNWVANAHQATCGRGTRKGYISTVTVYNKNVSCQFNLLAQIEQVQDINHYSDYKRRLIIMLLELKL